jgi:hypothetical protein
MFSYELLADGHYHTVELLAVKKNFTLRVDNGLARQDFSLRFIHRPVLKTKLCSGDGKSIPKLGRLISGNFLYLTQTS